MVEKQYSMSFDVVIIGGGPAGLACAIELMKKAKKEGINELNVCILEKGSEIGAHIISGAVIDPVALNELIPNWKELQSPVQLEVKKDKTIILNRPESFINKLKIPHFLVPKTMLNRGNYIISLSNLTRWLSKIAEEMGVTIFTSTCAVDLIYDEVDKVIGVITGDQGVSEEGSHKSTYQSGYSLFSKYTVLAEGCRGNIGKVVIDKFALNEGCDPQHYSIGIKELWEVDNEHYDPGTVIHGSGWPLSENNINGGWWLYHSEYNQISLGMFIDLSYSNPYLSPFREMQRWKHHPDIKKYLKNGKRISYGARAATKGGINSLPKLEFNGGCIIGDDAGFLNFSKIKGIHTSIKSGMICADSIIQAFKENGNTDKSIGFQRNYENSWLYEELYKSRNFGPAINAMGILIGSAFNFIDQNIFSIPFTIRNKLQDHLALKLKTKAIRINYPKPDGVISFDNMSSIYISNTIHEENQPCHLRLTNKKIPISYNLPNYDEPAQRYCPASVYEVVSLPDGQYKFQINFANCVHCKTCDIKDPSQNINWTPPEGGGGPNYLNM